VNNHSGYASLGLSVGCSPSLRMLVGIGVLRTNLVSEVVANERGDVDEEGRTSAESVVVRRGDRAMHALLMDDAASMMVYS
jgi:hypothetical protein